MLAEDRSSVCILRERECDFSKDLRKVSAFAMRLSWQRMSRQWGNSQCKGPEVRENLMHFRAARRPVRLE